MIIKYYFWFLFCRFFYIMERMEYHQMQNQNDNQNDSQYDFLDELALMAISTPAAKTEDELVKHNYRFGTIQKSRITARHRFMAPEYVSEYGDHLTSLSDNKTSLVYVATAQIGDSYTKHYYGIQLLFKPPSAE